MNKPNEIYVGIDVGKTWLDLAIWNQADTWGFTMMKME